MLPYNAAFNLAAQLADLRTARDSQESAPLALAQRGQFFIGQARNMALYPAANRHHRFLHWLLGR